MSAEAWQRQLFELAYTLAGDLQLQSDFFQGERLFVSGHSETVTQHERVLGRLGFQGCQCFSNSGFLFVAHELSVDRLEAADWIRHDVSKEHVIVLSAGRFE